MHYFDDGDMRAYVMSTGLDFTLWQSSHAKGRMPGVMKIKAPMNPPKECTANSQFRWLHWCINRMILLILDKSTQSWIV